MCDAGHENQRNYCHTLPKVENFCVILCTETQRKCILFMPWLQNSYLMVGLKTQINYSNFMSKSENYCVMLGMNLWQTIIISCLLNVEKAFYDYSGN